MISLLLIKFAIALPPITPVKIIPVIMPIHLADFDLILLCSKMPSAAPAPMLHIKIFAKYWYVPSLTLLETLDFQSFSVVMSATIPPATPPATGIAPKIDNQPISLNRSFEVILVGGGIILSKDCLSNFWCKVSTSFKY